MKNREFAKEESEKLLKDQHVYSVGKVSKARDCRRTLETTLIC